MAKYAISPLIPLKWGPNRGPTEAEEMHEENLANTLDRILAERLREFPAKHPKSVREAFYRALGWFRPGPHAKAEAPPDSAAQAETIARIRSLPSHAQVALRRYFVFREAEEGICSSIDVSPRQFRRFLRDAADYILLRQERMPQLEQRDRDRN